MGRMPTIFAVLAATALAVFVALAGVTTYCYGRRNLLHPVVLVNGIMAYYILVPATYFLATGMEAVPIRFGLANPERALAAALVVLLGMYVVILAAFHHTLRYETPAVGDTFAGAFANANPGVVLVLGIAGFGVGLLAYGYYVVVNGGLIRLLTVSPRTAFQTVSDTYRFRLFGLIGVFGGYATVLCALRPMLERRDNHPQVASSRPLLRALALAAVMTALVLFVGISTRARMVILVSALLTVVYFHTAGWLPRRVLIGVGAVVVLGIMAFSTLEGAWLWSDFEGTVATLLSGIVHIPRLALVMVLTERVPSEVFFQFGATLPEAFYLDLPGLPRYGNLVERIAIGVDKNQHLASAMLPGELWLNFGPVGILAGGVVYGAALRWAYRLRDHAQPLVRGVQPAVFVCVLLLWPTNLTWGVPNLFVRVLVPVLVAIVVTLVIQRRFPWIARAIYNRTETSE